MEALLEHRTIRGRFREFDLDNPHSLVSYARKGVKPKVFYELAAIIQMPEKTLATILNLSARTVSNYRERQKTLDPVQGEHLLKLVALYEKGERIFGNITEFNYWLQKPFWHSKETPLDWIVTPGGVDLIMEELDRLAMGYPV